VDCGPRSSGNWYRMFGVVISFAGRRQTRDPLHRSDEWTKTSLAHESEEQPWRRDHYSICAINKVLPARQTARQALDYEAAISGSLRRTCSCLRQVAY